MSASRHRHFGQGLRWLAAALWMGLIFFLSAQPDLPDLAGGAPEVQEVIGHFAVYAVLALLLRSALAAQGTRRPAVWAFALTLLYGLTDECHQLFVPGRRADPLDLAVDAAGAACALLLWRVVARVAQTRTG